LFTREIYAKEETFGISSPSTLEEDHEARQESRHAMNMTPNDLSTEVSTCKSSGTQPENSEACIARIQALSMKETTSNAHMQLHTNEESCKKQPGRKPGPNQAEMGLGRPAWADRPGPTGPAHSGPGSCPPFALGACLFIASASAGRDILPFIRESLRRMRSTGRKPTAAASPRVA
jgi:hypothetical protein